MYKNEINWFQQTNSKLKQMGKNLIYISGMLIEII